MFTCVNIQKGHSCIRSSQLYPVELMTTNFINGNAIFVPSHTRRMNGASFINRFSPYSRLPKLTKRTFYWYYSVFCLPLSSFHSLTASSSFEIDHRRVTADSDLQFQRKGRDGAIVATKSNEKFHQDPLGIKQSLEKPRA